MKRWKSDPEQLELRKFLRDLRKKTSAGESEAALSLHVEDFILSRKGAIQSFRAFWTSRRTIENLLLELQGILIRRDERSKNPDGSPLLNLFPKHTVISWLKLGERMKEALAKQTSTDERM